MPWTYKCTDYDSCAAEMVGETKEELARKVREHHFKAHGREMEIAEADAAIERGARRMGQSAA
ncbi:MAG: hypothetical protein BWY76_03402 [bacterium ADurb.Bin429]|nr:MAG: hypothetical protein BWY76_03402 [bacterium ADurb.Bin429]